MDPNAPGAWLPEHQLHVLATLAHIDSLIWRVGEVLYDYVSPPGPLEFDNVLDGDRRHVTVVSIAALPAIVSRCVADALTQMRAAIEHTVYAEAEHQLGRTLSDREARCIEMPACIDYGDFDKWLRNRGRPELPPLRRGAPLVKRMERLQPYHRRDASQHPLRILAEHTNQMKHRSPAVAATLVGKVVPDQVHPGLELRAIERPLRPGDVLASAPAELRVPLSIWPTVSLRRPHTSTWHVLMHELRDLEEWVREVAIPILIVGSQKFGPLPPQLDITRGHSDLRTVLESAGSVPAARRAERRLMAGTGRGGLVDTLALHPRGVPRNSIRDWVSSLDDDAVLDCLERLAAASADGGPLALAREADQLLGDVLGTTGPALE